ncbi:MAG: TonB-dependent receptor plug domain-containing protein [Burkholderiales bacterium]|nr:TonB-dependent receptor plug domain-containing protein [Burkholderiales bacterium]
MGKMPDKNVADSLRHVPGLTIRSADASEGGFDENDRVSMRGTNPSLNCTLINGHPVSPGDWSALHLPLAFLQRARSLHRVQSGRHRRRWQPPSATGSATSSASRWTA